MNIGINQTLKKIAKQNNITVDVVKHEIQHAITIAHSNPDPKIEDFWNNFACENREPSLQEVILHISKLIAEDYYSR